MNQGYYSRSRPTGRIPSWVLVLPVLLLLNFPEVRADDRLVLISPHWEGIRYEFERAFKAQYQR
ncbi:MAG: hypothetical protein ACREQW_09545, partial [Candidatus Binatia bacterium]